MSSQMLSGRRATRHMPSGRRVSGHLASGRSVCLTDTKCNGEWRPDNASHGSKRPDAAVTALKIARSLTSHPHSRTQAAGGSRGSESIQLYSLYLTYSYIRYLTEDPARAHSVASIIAFIDRKYHHLHTLFLTCLPQLYECQQLEAGE